MTTLVTGGAGFIGSNLVEGLLKAGHSVRVLDNFHSGFRDNLTGMEAVELLQGDIRDSEVVRRAVDGCETVFHLAASVGNERSIDDPVEDSEINVIGTLRLLDAARSAGVRKVVASSSAGIYGELKELPIQENHSAEPLTPYGASKLCMEKQCLAWADLHDVEVACLRYFNVYGPRQRFDAYGNAIPIFVFRALAGEHLEIYGDGEQTRDFVNVHDVVQANLRAATPGVPTGAYNVASGTSVTINRLVDIIRARIPGDTPVRHGPERPGDVRDSLADISRAREAFHFDPIVGLEEGIREYVDWAKTVARGARAVSPAATKAR